MITCTFEGGNKAHLRHATVQVLLLNPSRSRILLCRRGSTVPSPHKYCTPGGYANRNETTAEAAMRETQEETGYSTEELTLFRINDNPKRRKEDRQNIDFIYFAVAKEKVSDPDIETAETKWFDLDKIPVEADFAFDHRDNITLFIQYLKAPFPLPYTQIFP